MRTLSRRIDSSSAKSTFNDISHRHAGKPHHWRSGAEKYSPAAGYAGATVFQIGNDCLAYVCWQGQLRRAVSFAQNGKNSVLPINVLEIETCNFAASQAEPS